jgi:hypothetical protein
MADEIVSTLDIDISKYLAAIRALINGNAQAKNSFIQLGKVVGSIDENGKVAVKSVEALAKSVGKVITTSRDVKDTGKCY